MIYPIRAMLQSPWFDIFWVFSGYTDLWPMSDDDEWKPGYTCGQARCSTMRNWSSVAVSFTSAIAHRQPQAVASTYSNKPKPKSSVHSTSRIERQMAFGRPIMPAYWGFSNSLEISELFQSRTRDFNFESPVVNSGVYWPTGISIPTIIGGPMT